MRPTVLFTAASCVFGVQTAHAEVNSPRLGFELDLQNGAVLGQHTSGLGLSIAPRLRYLFLTLGVGVQGATELFDSIGSLSAIGGFSIPLGRLRLDASSEFGVNAYTGVGSGLVTENPGASGSVPFAGGRGALLVCVSCNRKNTSLWLGVAAHYNRDLYTQTQTYTYSESVGWFEDDQPPRQVETSVDIGQTRLAVFFSATFEFAL